MPFFEIINMNFKYQYSVSMLLKTYMENEGRYVLVMPPKPDSLYPAESFETAKSNAVLNAAKYFGSGILIISIVHTLYFCYCLGSL